MKSKFSKSLAACSVALAALFAGNAHADIYNPYTVQKPGTTGEANQFVADRMVAGYREKITFNADNTFDVSIFFDVSNFYFEGTELENSGLGSYDLYGTYKASGNVVVANGKTSFVYDTTKPSSLSFYLDVLNNTERTADAVDGKGSFSFSGTGDDLELAFGEALTGDGSVTIGCQPGQFCGGFTSETTVNLTGDGKKFFIAPNPFYNFSLQTGQLNTVNASGTQLILGSMDIMFNTPGEEVPEPASLGLLGLGLLGLGAARRRKQAK